MRTHSRLFRLTATTAIVGLALGPLLAQPGFAQSSPPPLAPPAAAPAAEPQTTADPPTRVGVVSRIVGQVSFHGADATDWSPASLNFPVTAGDAFWTQPAASADIGVTNDRMTMDQSTALDVTTLDDETVGATLPQGQVYLHLLALAQGEKYTIATPRGAVTIGVAGRYEISAGDTQTPTRVTVLEGVAQVAGSNVNLRVDANQTVLITGNDPYDTQVVPAQRDAFLTAQLARERPPAAVSGGVTAPAEVAQMTGGEELAQYGTWQDAPQYGRVWYPRVAAGFVPYRNGHWAYVAPWGWTWVDAAPWGFAPFHYGRWVQVGGRWGWAPGGGGVAYGAPGYVRPVYAPALVTFFGVGAAIGVGVGLAGGFHGNVGWCPLGWQEPYHPWYRTSPGYVRNVNVTSVRNVTNITTVNTTTVNTTTINTFANRNAATMVPATAMVASRPIAQVARPVPAAQLAQARPVVGEPPIRPTAATLGVTPRVAQQLHLAAPPPGATPPAHPPAPGPVIRAQAEAPNARPPLPGNPHPPAQAGGQPAPHGPETPNPAAAPHRPGVPNAPVLREPGAPAVPPHPQAAAPEPAAPAHPPTPQPHAVPAPQAPAREPPAHQPQVQAPAHEPTPPPQVVHPQPQPQVVHPQPQVQAPAHEPTLPPQVAHPQPQPQVVHPQPPQPQAHPQARPEDKKPQP